MKLTEFFSPLECRALAVIGWFHKNLRGIIWSAVLGGLLFCAVRFCSPDIPWWCDFAFIALWIWWAWVVDSPNTWRVW